MVFQKVIGVTLILLSVLGHASRLSAQDNSAARQEIEKRSREAFQKGMQALENDDPQAAIPSLISAIKLSPKNADYVHHLGVAYLRTGKFEPAWITFREAISLDPGHEASQTSFMSIWLLFRGEGLFDVGTGRKKIFEKLGTPDKRIGGDAARFVYGFMALDFKKEGTLARVLDLRGLDEASIFPVEQIKWNFSLEPLRKGSHFISRQGDFEVWIPAEKTMRDTKARLSVERFSNFRKGISIHDFAEKLKSTVTDRNSDVQWKLESESDNSLLYSWSGEAKESGQPMWEVGRVIAGKRDFYRVAYETQRELPNEVFLKWVQRLQGIELKPIPQVSGWTPESPLDANMTRFLAWEFGNRLSVSAWAHANGGDPDAVQSEFETVQSFARRLRVELAELPPVGQQRSKNVAAVLDYLLNRSGRSLQKAIQEKIGNKQAALFDMAIKTNVLRWLYTPNSQPAEKTLAAIATRADQAGLSLQRLDPLFEAMEKNSPAEEFSRLVEEFQKYVSDQLRPDDLKSKSSGG